MFLVSNISQNCASANRVYFKTVDGFPAKRRPTPKKRAGSLQARQFHRALTMAELASWPLEGVTQPLQKFTQIIFRLFWKKLKILVEIVQLNPGGGGGRGQLNYAQK